jgi:hypothetical protein
MAMRAGYPRWFSNHDYEENGHITPMSRVSLERALNECGFQVDGFRSVGGSEPIKGWWKLNLVSSLLKPLCNSSLTGQILMMWARKTGGRSMTGSDPQRRSASILEQRGNFVQLSAVFKKSSICLAVDLADLKQRWPDGASSRQSSDFQADLDL